MIRKLVLCLIGAGVLITTVHAEEVNLYSARKEKLIKPLLKQFSAETGIKVNLVTGKADALLKRLEAEGRNSPADLFITVDAGRLHRAKAAGVLQPVDARGLKAAVAEKYRDPEGYWYGLSLRARPIFYVKGKVDPAELSSYEDLARDKWRGRICIRGSGNIYNQSLMASMLIANGEAKTEAWAKAFVANFGRPPQGGDRDQIKAAAAGQCDIAIANTYYFGRMLKAKKDDPQRIAAEKMAIFWPNQGDRGVHVNVSGVGLTRAAKHRDAAIRLMEYLVRAESQKWYAEANNEYPVVAGIAAGPVVDAWGDFKADSINLSRLGEENAAAVRIMDRAGWK